jgi:hypothetical protein
LAAAFWSSTFWVIIFSGYISKTSCWSCLGKESLPGTFGSSGFPVINSCGSSGYICKSGSSTGGKESLPILIWICGVCIRMGSSSSSLFPSLWSTSL